MSQASRLASMDARLVRAFSRSGLADAATLNSIACDVMLDRNVQVLGQYGEVTSVSASATFQLSQVTPARGMTLVVGSNTWTLEKKLSGDESIAEWVLNDG
jgi:hypothetical protein